MTTDVILAYDAVMVVVAALLLYAIFGRGRR